MLRLYFYRLSLLHERAAEHAMALYKCYKLLPSKVDNFMSKRWDESSQPVSAEHTSR